MVVSLEEESTLSFKDNETQFERYRLFSIKNDSGTLRTRNNGNNNRKKDEFFGHKYEKHVNLKWEYPSKKNKSKTKGPRG